MFSLRRRSPTLGRRTPGQYVAVCIFKTILHEPLVWVTPFGAAQPIRINGAVPERNGRVASPFRCALKSRFGQRPVAIRYLARSYPKFQPKPPHTTCGLQIAFVTSRTPYSLPAHSACVATRWLSNLIHCALLKRPVSQQIGFKPTGLVNHWPSATLAGGRPGPADCPPVRPKVMGGRRSTGSWALERLFAAPLQLAQCHPIAATPPTPALAATGPATNQNAVGSVGSVSIVTRLIMIWLVCGPSVSVSVVCKHSSWRVLSSFKQTHPCALSSKQP